MRDPSVFGIQGRFGISEFGVSDPKPKAVKGDLVFRASLMAQ